MARIDNIINVGSVFSSTTILPVLDSVTLNVWIYTGTQGNDAALNVALAADGDRVDAPTYSLSSTAVTKGSDQAVQFDIAPLIRDYIESELNQTHNSENAVWVDLQETRVINGTELTQPSEHFLALDGYEYTTNIVGNQIDEVLRTSNRHLLNSEGKDISYPLLREGINTYVWTNNGIAVPQVPPAPSSSNESNEQIIYAVSPSGETVDTLRVTYTDATTEEITIENVCEGRYEHKKLTFVNRLGAFQDVYFFANHKRTLSTTADSWHRRNKVSGGGAYRPTTVRNITAVNEQYTLNSGFYPESNNVVFEELVQSNSVWITEGIETFPIIIKDSSFNFKDSNTEKAINYTINFEYAFNKMRSL